MRLCTWIASAVIAVLPMGCGTIGLFGSYDVRESADVADAEWPRLVDVPQAPEVGAYSDSVPDPAIGIALGADVGQITSEADAKAQRLAAPVLTDEDRAAMGLE